MAKIISIINNKGGAGKTATTSVLSEILASLGNQILLVDLDGQCNLTMIFRTYKEIQEKSIRNIFSERIRNREKVKECIQHTDIEGIDIIPADSLHSGTPALLDSEQIGNTSIILKRALDSIKNDYDFILIDNAPASNKLTVNSMLASDYILCPAKSELLSYEGVINTLKNIRAVQDDYMHDSLKFLGIFLVATEPNTNVHKEMAEQYRREFGDKFFKSYIRKDVKIQEMQRCFRPLLEIGPSSNALYDYISLLLECHILPESQQRTLEATIQEV